MNETRFQYIRNRSQQDGNNTIPTIVVQDAFIAGGSQVGLAHNDEDRWELQNYSTWTKGRHILRFGVASRGMKITDFSPQNFGGTFTFSGGNAPQLDANNQIVLRRERPSRARSDHQHRTLSPHAAVPGQSKHARARRRCDAVFARGWKSRSLGYANRHRRVCSGRMAPSSEPHVHDGPPLRTTNKHQQQLQLCAASVLRVGAGRNERRRWSRRAVEFVAEDGDSRRHGRLLRSLW